jgi:hypothetical protein
VTTDLHSLVAAYALDALDDGERIDFEAHLATCTPCTAELAGFAEVVAGLAEATSVAAPPNLRDRVLSRIGEIEQVPAPVSSNETPERRAPVVSITGRRRRTLSVAHLLTGAAAAILLLVGAIVVVDLGGGSDYDDVASASDAMVAQLTGDSGSVDVAYSAQLDRVAVRGKGVDDLEPGLRYALWAIADDTPIPAGLFDTDDGTIDDAVELADVDAEAWGITIEPETGSDTPTGEILYYAEV